MIFSMTAFARESAATNHGVLTVELRSVNHRYLDCYFKLPDALRTLESRLREQAGETLSRGKLDCLVRVQNSTSDSSEYQVNTAKLEELLAAAQGVSEKLPAAAPYTALDVLQFPGVYGPPEQSEEALQEQAQALFQTALGILKENREREGEKLATLVLDRLQQVETQVTATRELMPQLMQQQRERITQRIAELDMDVDQNRLEQELVYLAQKADVDEELDRLDAHIGEVRRTLKKGGTCGRRLDFLMQELNREANTLSSKSFSANTTQNAVELKVLIEQMREQIQNIE